MMYAKFLTSIFYSIDMLDDVFKSFDDIMFNEPEPRSINELKSQFRWYITNKMPRKKKKFIRKRMISYYNL